MADTGGMIGSLDPACWADAKPRQAGSKISPRVLIWYQGRGGAGNRMADRLAARLSPAIPPENVALALHSENSLIPLARARGHEVFQCFGPTGREAPFTVATSLRRRWSLFSRAVDAFRPNITIVVMNFALAWPLSYAAMWRNSKMIYVVHDPEPHVGDYAPMWQRYSQRLLIRQAAGVIALSDHARRRAEALGLAMRRPLDVVPLHTLGNLRRTDARPARVEAQTSFLFIGRLIAYKGLDLLRDAVERLAHRTDWRLTIAGNGPEREATVKMFKEFPQVDLSQLAWLSESQFDALIETHDVLINPYRDASQSGVVAEAMLDGMPSIVTPVGALPEQIDHGGCGWLARNVSGEAIAEAMAAAIAQRDAYSEMSARVINFWERTQLPDIWPHLVRRALVGGSAQGRVNRSEAADVA